MLVWFGGEDGDFYWLVEARHCLARTAISGLFMKLKKSTWLLIFLTLILGGWVYFYEIRGTEKRSQIQTKQQQIFNFPEEKIKKITITKSENVLEFVRTGNSDRPWQMKQPEDVPASDATISFLLDLVAKGKKVRSFAIPISNLSQYGLDQSATKITIELKDRESREIVLGNANFSDRLVYALVNSSTNFQTPTAKNTTVMLVSKNWYYAVERDLSEWKQTP